MFAHAFKTSDVHLLMHTSPGTLLAPRDEEVSGVKPGGAWHQPHRGAGAGGPGPSLRDSTAQNEAGAQALAGAWPGDGATALGTDRAVLPRESAVKCKNLL